MYRREHFDVDRCGGFLEPFAICGNAHPGIEPVVHRYGDLRLQRLRHARGLVDGHHVATVTDRQERDVAADPVELGQVVGVTGVVVRIAAELEDVADPVVPLRGRLQTGRVDVVRRHRFDLHPGDVEAVAGFDRFAFFGNPLYVIRRAHDHRPVLFYVPEACL